MTRPGLEFNSYWDPPIRLYVQRQPDRAWASWASQSVEDVQLAKTGCWSKPTQPATWTCRLIRPSGQWAPSTSLAFPLHFFANLRQFSTAPILQSVLLLNQKFRTQWKAVHSVSETAGCGALCSGSSPGFQGCSSVRLVYHFGPRPNQKPAPSQTERAAAHSSTSPWKS